jgi:putative addiction module component (TIGR02574 family)
MRVNEIQEIAKLSIPEKILLVEDLWDNIATKGEDVPIPYSHEKELNKRLEKYQSAPGDLLTFEELQVRIEKRK